MGGNLKDRLKNRFVGSILGVAVGDALGMQVEELSREEILSMHGVVRDYGKAPEGHPNDRLEPGMYTDDTEQTITLLVSIIEKGRFDVGHFAMKISEWGKQIMEHPELDRFSGGTSKKAIKKLLEGIDWMESGEEGTTCGSAMRVAPIGLFYYYDLDFVEKFARMSSTPTHSSHGARAGAMAVALGVACCINDYPIEKMVVEVVKRTAKEDEELADKIQLAYEIREVDLDEAVREIGNSSSVYETVPFSFYSYFGHADRFEDAVITAVNAGGDTDSIGAITGGMAGARHGVESIPDRWLKNLENKEYLIELAEKLYILAVKDMA
jgi:ADP-ribosylglycohydrolase